MATPKWITNGKGTIEPQFEWSFLTSGPLVSLKHCTESEETFLADYSGALYRLTPQGEVTHHSRNYKGIDLFTWSENSEAGVACLDSNKVMFIMGTLESEWSAKFREMVTALAIAPSADYVAISFDNKKTVIYDRYKTKIATLETRQPLTNLAFCREDNFIVGCSDTGLISAFELDGDPYWEQIPTLQSGQICLNNKGTRIYIASYSRGIQVFNNQGDSVGTYQIKGTPNRIDYNEFGERLAVGTTEGHLIWLNSAGTVLWATGAADIPVSVQCGSCSKRLIAGLASGEVVSLRW